MEARGPPELLFHQRHEVQWGPLFDAQCFLLMWEEVFKESILYSCPFSLPVGDLYVVLIVDLDHMLKVFPPPAAAEICRQQRRVSA